MRWRNLPYRLHKRSAETFVRQLTLEENVFNNPALAVLAVVLAGTMVQPVSGQTSTVADPLGDLLFPFNPPFQDFVLARVTRTASGDFQLHMEMAAPVPVAPSLPSQGRSEIWWFWIFDLDPSTQPQGYPWQNAVGRPPEFIVYVSWNGTTFAGNAIDRRPLLTGGAAVITPVTFSTNGTIVEAVLPSAVIGAVPATFGWGAFTSNWSGPVGSEGFNFADYSDIPGVFNP
jgi:hypothetical protein